MSKLSCRALLVLRTANQPTMVRRGKRVYRHAEPPVPLPLRSRAQKLRYPPCSKRAEPVCVCVWGGGGAIL